MATSLAAQLSGIKARNSTAVLDKSKRKKIHSVSLVFESKEAASQSFEAIFGAALSAFKELETVDPRFSQFSYSLFAPSSIRFDRLLQTTEQASSLNHTIKKFLALISCYFHLKPSIYALEWLVRRFHIFIHNTEDLLLAALPWYDQELFVRILDIVPASGFPQVFGFLATSKADLNCPSRNALVRVFSRDENLFTLVNKYIQWSISNHLSYSRQLTFWATLNISVMMVFKEAANNSIIDNLLPLISEILPLTDIPDAQIASYMILAIMASQFSMLEDVINATVSTIITTWSEKSWRQGVACIAQLLNQQEELAMRPFSINEWNELNKIPDLENQFMMLGKSYRIDNFVTKFTLSLLEYDNGGIAYLLEILQSAKLHPVFLTQIAENLVDFCMKQGPFDLEQSKHIVRILEWLLEEHDEIFTTVMTSKTVDMDTLELALQSSIRRPKFDVAEEETVNEALQPAPQIQGGLSLAEIKMEFDELEPSKALSYLDMNNYADFATRADLWIRASSCVDVSQTQALSLVRVGQSAEPSFLLALAMSPYPVLSRIAALTVLEKRFESLKCYNYQVFLPAFLCLFADGTRRVRSAALEAFRKLAEFCSNKHSEMWGVDIVYGPSSKNLVWLAKSDLSSVLKHLLEHTEEINLDESFILGFTRKAGKEAWHEFLVTHAISTSFPQILKAVLRCLRHTRNIMQDMQPLYANWLQGREQMKEACNRTNVPLEDIERALVVLLQRDEYDAVTFLTQALKNPIELATVAADQIVKIWRRGKLEAERQNFVLRNLIGMALDEDIEFDSTDVLNRITLNSDNFDSILRQCRLQRDQLTVSSTPKRLRRRSSNSLRIMGPKDKIVHFAELHLRKVTLVLELLDKNTSNIENPGLLFENLFDILDELISLDTDMGVPVLYTEELLASVMINLVEETKRRSLDPNAYGSIRANVIVSCIRTSSSPQVQNKFLLLIASLASICPDIVLHSVMPIFTFMGANTVRMDNDYSNHVFLQTISKVIPALVAYGGKQREINIALMTFVTSFPHIPRHRRNKLFSELVKTLGTEESLHKVLLLFGQKYAEALKVRRSGDGRAIVLFTTTFLRSFTVREQLLSTEKYLTELYEYINSPLDKPDVDGVFMLVDPGLSATDLRVALLNFLFETLGSNEVVSGTQPLRVQIARAQEYTTENMALCGKMIDLLLGDQSTDGSAEDPAFKVLSVCLDLLSMQEFVRVVTPLLCSESPLDLRIKVLELIGRKFSYEMIEDIEALSALKTELEVLERNIVSSTGKFRSEVIDVVDQLIVKFGHSLEPELMLHWLDVMTGQCGLLNDNTLVELSAICCINSLCQHLGARMIGHFSRIIPILFAQCDSLLSPAEQDMERSRLIQLATFGLISGLVQRIPSFMTSCSKRVFEIVFASHVDVEARERLVELLIEKLDRKTLFASYVCSWNKALQGGFASVELFISSLGSLVEASTKKDLAEMAHQLTSLLLDCFGVRSEGRFNINEINQIESHIVQVGMKIVMKLNDKVFRPQFVRMVRWAFEGEGTIVPAQMRHLVMFKFVAKLLGSLRSIVTSYYGYFFDYTCEILRASSDDFEFSNTLHKLILQTLFFSFSSDQDDFWQSPSRFDQVLEVLVFQLSRNPIIHGPLLVKTLVAFAETCSSEQYRKKVSEALSSMIASTRTSSEKIWTIRILSSLYKRSGESWISRLPPLVPFVAELLDDEDEHVESEVRLKLVPVLEEVLGESLDKYIS